MFIMPELYSDDIGSIGPKSKLRFRFKYGNLDDAKIKFSHSVLVDFLIGEIAYTPIGLKRMRVSRLAEQFPQIPNYAFLNCKAI